MYLIYACPSWHIKLYANVSRHFFTYKDIIFSSTKIKYIFIRQAYNLINLVLFSLLVMTRKQETILCPIKKKH